MARRRGGFRKRQPLGVNIELIGVPGLQKKLLQLTLTVQKQITDKALKVAAKKHLKPAIDANLARVSPGDFGTGRLKTLRSNINRRKIKSKRSVHRRVYTPSREKLGLQGEQAYYPFLLEKGSSARGMEPQNMLKQAGIQKSGITKSTIAKELIKGIDAKVRKLGRKAFR